MIELGLIDRTQLMNDALVVSKRPPRRSKGAHEILDAQQKFGKRGLSERTIQAFRSITQNEALKKKQIKIQIHYAARTIVFSGTRSNGGTERDKFKSEISLYRLIKFAQSAAAPDEQD
jgi:hypothetical protein